MEITSERARGWFAPKERPSEAGAWDYFGDLKETRMNVEFWRKLREGDIKGIMPDVTNLDSVSKDRIKKTSVSVVGGVGLAAATLAGCEVVNNLQITATPDQESIVATAEHYSMLKTIESCLVNTQGISPTVTIEADDPSAFVSLTKTGTGTSSLPEKWNFALNQLQGEGSFYYSLNYFDENNIAIKCVPFSIQVDENQPGVGYVHELDMVNQADRNFLDTKGVIGTFLYTGGINNVQIPEDGGVINSDGQQFPIGPNILRNLGSIGSGLVFNVIESKPLETIVPSNTPFTITASPTGQVTVEVSTATVEPTATPDNVVHIENYNGLGAAEMKVVLENHDRLQSIIDNYTNKLATGDKIGLPAQVETRIVATNTEWGYASFDTATIENLVIGGYELREVIIEADNQKIYEIIVDAVFIDKGKVKIVQIPVIGYSAGASGGYELTQPNVEKNVRIGGTFEVNVAYSDVNGAFSVEGIKQWFTKPEAVAAGFEEYRDENRVKMSALTTGTVSFQDINNAIFGSSDFPTEGLVVHGLR